MHTRPKYVVHNKRRIDTLKKAASFSCQNCNHFCELSLPDYLTSFPLG